LHSAQKSNRLAQFMSNDTPMGETCHHLLRDRVGLCARCIHAREIESSRGSVFYLCGLSDVDPAFPKYPRLPVIQCSGFRDSADNG
jgi:hypothetical protein